MLLSITQYGDPILRTACAAVTQPAEEHANLAANMLETMYAADGVGLAAPQVGLSLRMVVIDIPQDESEGEGDIIIKVNGEDCSLYSIMPLVFINPIIEPFGPQELFTEGCLSVRDIRSNVMRPTKVRASLPQLDGSVLEVECDGLLARCLQHEVDHLDGKLFVDRVSSASRLTLAKKLKRMLPRERYYD